MQRMQRKRELSGEQAGQCVVHGFSLVTPPGAFWHTARHAARGRLVDAKTHSEIACVFRFGKGDWARSGCVGVGVSVREREASDLSGGMLSGLSEMPVVKLKGQRCLKELNVKAWSPYGQERSGVRPARDV